VKNRIVPDISLAIVLSEPAPVTAGPPGRPAGVAEQTQQVFHELHADGRNALCAVCDRQYGWA
jgi:hypothetical protein